MRLAFGLLGLGSAALTGCAGGKSLFEVTCAASTGFTVTINEACRTAKFPMVNFIHSYIWGDKTVTVMVTPTGTAGSDVVTSGVCVDSTGTTLAVKPTQTMTDSDGASAYGWASIALDSCGISGVEATDSTTQALYYEYSLFWNDILSPAATSFFQLGQTELKCRFDADQHDAASLSTISEDTQIADPSEKNVDLATDLTLQIGKVVFDGSSIDEAALSAYLASDTATGQASLSYAATTTANLGDYMELKLVDGSTAQVLTSKFSLSLTKCWASQAALAATATAYADTSTSNTADEFVFFDSFCSKYPSWVAPNDPTVTTGYLKETWDRLTSLQAVHFRQFGFVSDQANYVAGSNNELYYHCFVKVCEKTDESSCSTTTLTGSAVSCSASTFTAPAKRRRRSETVSEHRLLTSKITGNLWAPSSKCASVINNICLP